MAKKTKKNEKKYIYIIPAVLWMIFIFYMSSRTGDDSSAVSNPMTDFIVGLFQKVRNDSAPVVDRMTGVVEIMVRKGAHMTEYGILLALLALAVRKTGGRMASALSLITHLTLPTIYSV